jgi:UDP-GlcNAc:undecaprenyl-phosphate GlcNAc-1-phosphate transferase
MLRIAVPFLVAFATSLILTPAVRAAARRLGFVARPSVDRWHSKPTALMGGIGIYLGSVAGIGAGWMILDGWGDGSLGPRTAAGIAVASTMMFLSGLGDDIWKFRPSTKLVLQLLAAAALVSSGVVYPVTAWAPVNVLATLFWFVALTNALNLLDNMDGVAVGVAGIAAIFLAITFGWGGSPVLVAICVALAGATAGFLPYNFKPASIFMGDSGSLFLGSLLAGLGATFPHNATGSIVAVLFIPALIVILPILDTLLVTVTRTLAGRPISAGGRDHTSHRLVALGLSERQAAAVLYVFALTGGALALVLQRAKLDFALGIGAIFLVVLLVCAAYLARMHTYSPDEVGEPGRITVLVTDLLYKRRALEVLMDATIFTVSYYGAFLLRFDRDIPLSQMAVLETTLALVVAAKLTVFLLAGVYRGSWVHLGIEDAHRLMRALGIGTLVTATGLVFVFREAEFSRSVLLIDAMITGILTLGSRFSFRSFDTVLDRKRQVGSRVLIYGTGEEGEMVMRLLRADPASAYLPVGFIDRDTRRRGSLIHGLPVFGTVDELATAAASASASVAVCGTGVSEGELERLAEVGGRAGVRILQMEATLRPVTAGRPEAASELRVVG